METLLRNKLTLVAVLGAGVIVGISGLYMYLKYDKYVTRELHHLSRSIDHLRKDIDELKAASRRRAAILKQARSSSERSIANDRSSGDDENDEYFDVSNNDMLQTVDQTWTKSEETVSVRDELTSFYEETDILLDGGHVERLEAYSKYMLMKEDNISNAEFMWRLSKACNLLSNVESDAEKKKQLIFDGMKYASISLALDENIGESHKWYAISIGKATDYLGAQEKINNGYQLIEHINRAIELIPEDHTLYFLKGRWCYGVSQLSWLERKFATALLGEPPKSSFEEALEQFKEVERLKPENWKENLLYIAKCLIEGRNYSDAISWLDKAAQLPCDRPEDTTVHAEVTTLLTKYKGHRNM